jgi:GTP cyclohydrolase I
MARNRPVSRRPSAAEKTVPSLAGMETAVRQFLAAARLDPAEHPELAQTPALVARAWAEEFLDGYQVDPAATLAERMPASGEHGGLVVVSRLAYQSVCPHHLLPYGGTAHLAYQPQGAVVGFGQIAKLLDCLSHRLVLQEDLALQLAQTLQRELGARGAGVLLEAEQSCLALRGGRRTGSKVVAEAYAGAMIKDGELRSRFLSAVRGG